MPYKEYNQNTPLLLPPSLDELIGKDEFVRILNSYVDSLPYSSFASTFHNSTSAPSFHPRMMLKVILHAYMNKIYSSRAIEYAVCHNIDFMWLAAMQRPDHNTINRFRTDYLVDSLRNIYDNLICLLLEKGLIKNEDYFVDGTILEANAGKNTHVWRKNTERYKAKVQERAKEIFEEIDRINKEEDDKYGANGFPLNTAVEKISSAEIKKITKSLEKKMVASSEKEIGNSAESQNNNPKQAGASSEKPVLKKENQCDAPSAKKQDDAEVEKNNEESDAKSSENISEKNTIAAQPESLSANDKKIEKLINPLNKEVIKLEKYEEQEKILNGRNSYSKTDHDATFMRMKGTDELRGGYNNMIGTENGFVVGFMVGQNPNDATLFIDLMEERKKLGIPEPKNTMGDSIFGTEENYAYLEKEGIKSYLKYPKWLKEMKDELPPYEKSRFKYIEEQDIYIYPQGKELALDEESERVSKSGYVSHTKKYKCAECSNCPVKEQCANKSGNRTIERVEELERYMKEARENLATEKGIELRKRRGPEDETVFGDTKFNRMFERLHLRGLKKCTTELFYMFIGYNLRRMVNKMKENWRKIFGNNDDFTKKLVFLIPIFIFLGIKFIHTQFFFKKMSFETTPFKKYFQCEN